MTIPIIPGPWSFLPQAAQAFTNTVQAGVQAKDYYRQVAQDKLGKIQNMITAGILSPSVFSLPEYQDLQTQAGLPTIQSPNIVPATGEIRARALQSVAEQAPPGGATQRAIAGAGITEPEAQKEDIAAQVGARVQPGSAAEAEISAGQGLPTEGLAQSEFAARSQQLLTQSMQQSLNQQILSTVPYALQHSPGFLRDAQAALMGTGPIDVERIRAAIELGKMNVELKGMDARTFTTALTTGIGMFQQRYQTWYQQSQKAQGDFSIESGIQPTDRHYQEKLQKFMADWYKQNPEPKLMETLGPLGMMAGMSPQQLQGAVGQAISFSIDPGAKLSPQRMKQLDAMVPLAARTNGDAYHDPSFYSRLSPDDQAYVDSKVAEYRASQPGAANPSSAVRRLGLQQDATSQP